MEQRELAAMAELQLPITAWDGTLTSQVGFGAQVPVDDNGAPLAGHTVEPLSVKPELQLKEHDVAAAMVPLQPPKLPFEGACRVHGVLAVHVCVALRLTP